MDFEILGNIAAIEPFALGGSIRDRRGLQRVYGKGRWKKLKGIATFWSVVLYAQPRCTGTRRMSRTERIQTETSVAGLCMSTATRPTGGGDEKAPNVHATAEARSAQRGKPHAFLCALRVSVVDRAAL